MFDKIALRYDFLNHLMSFGVDKTWRRRAVKMISGKISGSSILDVATGTADLAIEAMRFNPQIIHGIDVSKNMLEKGNDKLQKKGLNGKIELFYAASENIPYDNISFDVVMSAFGVRNFNDLDKGLSEMFRVLRTGGTIMILEFSKPSTPVFSHLYRFYFLKILPFIGKLVSKDVNAYTYLPASVMEFPDNEDFMYHLTKTGFLNVYQKRLTFGVASVYIGIKDPTAI